jgi:hypothetical protein
MWVIIMYSLEVNVPSLNFFQTQDQIQMNFFSLAARADPKFNFGRSSLIMLYQFSLMT